MNVEPLGAVRRLTAAAARALRITKRQPHFEREIRAQEIRKVGAVGAKDDLHRVLAETQMVEQDIARLIAQHIMQRRPRRRGVQRVIEKLLDPCREQVFRRAIPCVAQGPDDTFGRARRRGPVGAHGDVAGDRAAPGRRAVASERRAPRPRGRRLDLGEPEIRRPAVALAGFRRDASVGRDQRKLALERLLRGENDAQRRALPRRNRRRQDRDLGRIFTGAGRALRPRVRHREKKGGKSPCYQQKCWRSRRKMACWKQLRPLASLDRDQTITPDRASPQL